MTPRHTLGALGAACALLAAGPGHAAPSLTLDLASPPPGANVTRVYGHGIANGGTFGVPVFGGHDCDGDGDADFGFAQFLNSPFGRTYAGEVTVVFGDGTVGATLDSDVWQAGMLRVAGEGASEHCGDEAWMDDVTGDGLGDLLVGRQNYTLDVPLPGVSRPGAGALSILVGDPGWRTHAATLTPLDLGAPPAGLKVITFVGPASYDRLGIWMRTGDITGDGIADILVGADEVDPPGASIAYNQGAAFVIRGGPHLMEAPFIVDLADFGQASFPEALKGHVAWIDPPSGSFNHHFGATVQVADLDGNRRAEVLVASTLSRAGATLRLPGAPFGTGEGSGGAQDGIVFIVWDENFPPGPWPEDHRFTATSPPYGDATEIVGDGVARTFGEEIVAGLDFSGDGLPDLMVGDLLGSPNGRGAAGRGYIFYNAGNLRGLSFDLDVPPAGVVVSRILGPVAEAISSDTVVQGDFDGDGIDDLGIGSPCNSFTAPTGFRDDAGTVHVLYGQPGGWPAIVDLHPSFLPGPEVMRIALVMGANGRFYSDKGDTLCYSAAPGDINGDGRPDLIVNEMAANGSLGTPEDVGNMIIIDAASLLDPVQPSLEVPGPEPVDFGAVQVTGGLAMETVTITNSGTGPVAITSLVLTGPQAADFSIFADSGEGTLAAGGSRVVTVRFDPARVSRCGAALRIRTGVDPHPIGVGLRGCGVDDALLVPEVAIRFTGSDAVLEFPSQFGTGYTLLRDGDLSTATPLFSVEGTGQLLYLTDPEAADLRSAAFYRVLAGRD